MRSGRREIAVLAVGWLVLATSSAPALAQVVAADAYVVGSIPLPAINQGGVAFAGTGLLVGQGSFGARAESIARVERDGSATTVVTDLNSIGGLAYDAAYDRVLFTDNAFELSGTVTGDTVYALPAPRATAASVSAATLELLPAGSIPFASPVLPLPDGTVLVSDAPGAGVGRVVHVDGGVASDLIAGLDFVGGLALTAGGELLVGELDSTTFLGAVLRFDLAGTPTAPLVTGLSGALDQALDEEGHLLVTGGFTPGFGSSTVVRVAPDGAVTEIASGFGFSTAIDVDRESGQVAVLDFGVPRAETLLPIRMMTAGGRKPHECRAEWWGGTFDRRRSGRPKSQWSCVDGAACDRDGEADGACTFLVGACFAVPDPRIPRCTAGAVDVAVVSNRGRTRLPAADALQLAVGEVLPAAAAVCSRAVPVEVAGGRKPVTLRLDARADGRRVDRDRLRLRCHPADA